MLFSLKLRLAIALLSCLTSFIGAAQLTGQINYDRLGISLTIPEGWIGSENDANLMLGSQTLTGVIIITPHTYGKEALIEEAQNGIYDENGTALLLNGELKELAKDAIAGNFSGSVEYQPADAYIIGIANPYETGSGVTIMALTQKGQLTHSHIQACHDLFQSLKFSKIDRTNDLKEWRDWLSNSRLTYMDSYYSSDYTDGGVSGGYSSETIIHLCAGGYFKFGSSSNVSASGSGVSGYNYGSSQGDGTWEVKANANSNLVLILNFHNGEKYTYELTYEDNKLYLNGDRFYYTTEGEYAPDCY